MTDVMTAKTSDRLVLHPAGKRENARKRLCGRWAIPGLAFLVPDFTVKFGLVPKSHLIDVSMREVQAAQPEGKTTAFVHAIIVWGRA
jgi:hypothetical protein